jgi:hypothetical protein
MPKERSEASKRGRRSKAKGKSFEKSVALDIAAAFELKYGITADCDVTTTRSGQDDCDIGLSARAKELYPVWTECKDCKTLSVPAWLQQVAEAQTRHKDNRTPVIVFKQHGKSKKQAIIPFGHLLDLYRELAQLRRFVKNGYEEE